MGCGHLHSSEIELETTYQPPGHRGQLKPFEDVSQLAGMLRSDSGLVLPKHLHLALRDSLALSLRSTKHVGSELLGV